LWRITTDYLYLFCFIVIFSYGFIGLVLRFVLRPLLAVEQQANDICERRFTINETIPKTRELRRVVEAMNRMTQKIHEMFDRQVKLTENLRDEARIDHLTGLSNRKEFNALTTALLKTEGGGPGPSALMLMQIKDFADLNTSLGRDAGDELLSQVATRLQAAVQNRKGAILARYNGADFAIFLPSISLEHARVTLQGCFNAVASLKTFTDEALVDAIHIGMTFDSQPQQLAGMLTEADAAATVTPIFWYTVTVKITSQISSSRPVTGSISLNMPSKTSRLSSISNRCLRCQTDSRWQRSYMSASHWMIRSFKPAYSCRWPNVLTC
jgi:diguanylate cyclase (GGDEF)-like protein